MYFQGLRAMFNRVTRGNSCRDADSPTIRAQGANPAMSLNIGDNQSYMYVDSTISGRFIDILRDTGVYHAANTKHVARTGMTAISDEAETQKWMNQNLEKMIGGIFHTDSTWPDDAPVTNYHTVVELNEDERQNAALAEQLYSNEKLGEFLVDGGHDVLGERSVRLCLKCCRHPCKIG